MLDKYMRLRMVNNTDQTLTFDSGARIAIRMAAWKLTSGVLGYTTITEDMGFSAGETIVASGEVEGTVIDNTSNLNWGIKGTFEVIANANSTDGSCDLYLEESEDNVHWPSEQADFDIAEDLRPVCILNLSTDAVDEGRMKNFEF